MALASFDKMAAVLQKESDINVGFMRVKEAAASVLSGISNVVISSASLARVDAKDTRENITGFTGNSSTGGIVSGKKRVSNSHSFGSVALKFAYHLG